MRGLLLCLRSSSGVAKMAASSSSLERSRPPHLRGMPAVPQPLASRPTARSSCAVRVREARHPGATPGAPHTLPKLACVAVRAARSLPAAGSNLQTIAFRGSSQPHRAWCGWRSLLSLPPPNPSLPHHQSSLAQVSRRSPKAAAAVQPTTKGAGPCWRRPRASQLAGCGRHRRLQERPWACWRCPVYPCGAGSGSCGRQEQEGPG